MMSRFRKIPNRLANATICIGTLYLSKRLYYQENDHFKVNCDNSINKGKRDQYFLQNVHVFFRHGARTPLSHMPGVDEVVYDRRKLLEIPDHTNIAITVQTPDGQPRPDPKVEEKYRKIQFKGDMYAGMLTKIGREQTYSLGQRLRARYINKSHFLGRSFTTKEVVIRSTNIDRSIYSLQCVLAGMFGKETFKEEVVIPVVPHRSEILYPNVKFCDTLRQLEQKTPNYLGEQNGYKFVQHYIKYFINKKDDKDIGMMAWRDHLVARQAHGLEVPLWLTAIEDHVQIWATKALEIYMCGIPQDRSVVLQLSAGPMLNLVVQGMESNMKGENSGKLFLYSCHDSSLLPLLCALGIFDHKWPPYAADITIELYQNQQGNYFVKISYCEEDITLPGYDTPMIPYDKFKELITPFVVAPSEYMKRCHDIELAREHAKQWEAIIKAHEQEGEEEDLPPNM